MREIILTILCIALFGSFADAQTGQRDLEVIGRALNFVEGASGQERTIAIVYEASDEAEANELASLMDGGLRAGRVTLTARLVSIQNLSSLDGVDAAILVGSTSENSTAFDAASSRGVMTVSTNMQCVENARCVMGVQSNPSVKVVVNRNAANGSSVSFTAAFAMMVEEI